MANVDYKQYIEVDKQIRFGKPVIKGTRITVYDVLQWLASGLTQEQIISDHPKLTENEISACISYAAKQQLRL